MINFWRFYFNFRLWKITFCHDFHDDEGFRQVQYAESYYIGIASLRVTIESVLTPFKYKNHTEIYRSNVSKRPIWFKTCDDTVTATYLFCLNLAFQFHTLKTVQLI